MAKGFIRRPRKHQPSLSPLRTDPSLVPAPSRTMPCGSSIACSPERLEVTLYPRLLFTYSNLLVWLSIRGLVGKRGAGTTCSAAGSVAASIKAPQQREREGMLGRPVGEGRGG